MFLEEAPIEHRSLPMWPGWPAANGSCSKDFFLLTNRWTVSTANLDVTTPKWAWCTVQIWTMAKEGRREGILECKRLMARCGVETSCWLKTVYHVSFMLKNSPLALSDVVMNPYSFVYGLIWWVISFQCGCTYVRLIVLLAPLSVYQPISCMDHAWGHCIILCSSIYNYSSMCVLGMCVYSILKQWVEERKGKQPTDQSQRLPDP